MIDYYSIPKFAKAAGYHRDTIRDWIRRGQLSAARVGSRGHFRIPASELRRIMALHSN